MKATMPSIRTVASRFQCELTVRNLSQHCHGSLALLVGQILHKASALFFQIHRYWILPTGKAQSATPIFPFEPISAGIVAGAWVQIDDRKERARFPGALFYGLTLLSAHSAS